MAMRSNGRINVEVYFRQTSEQGDGKKAADLTLEAKDGGARIAPIFEPRIHAKVLTWDSDFVVVSSQN
jgi:hypothetical protein